MCQSDNNPIRLLYHRLIIHFLLLAKSFKGDMCNARNAAPSMTNAHGEKAQGTEMLFPALSVKQTDIF